MSSNECATLSHASSPTMPTSKKRKMDCSDSSQNDQLYLNNNGHAPFILGRHFVPIQQQLGVYVSEVWQPNCTLYRPLTEDLLINVRKAEQISCGEGSHFIADDCGNFSHKAEGKVLHLWKFDKSLKKLYISRSFLFTNLQAYATILHHLQQM